MRKLLATLLVPAGLMMGCLQAGGGSAPPGGPGTLAIETYAEDEVTGSFFLGPDMVTFDSRALGDGELAITVELRGLVLDATIETTPTGRVWTQDGYSEDGEDTAMTEDDARVLRALVKALEEEKPDIAQGTGPARELDSVLNYWAQWIPVISLRRIKFEDGERATNLCYYAQDSAGNYASTTGSAPTAASYRWLDTATNWAGHDCGSTWLGGSNCNGDPLQGGGKNKCSTIAQLGDHFPPGGGGVNTYSWINGVWTASVPNHVRTYQVGDCFGRYGADCGSGHSYNQESTSHDQCVRNGHNLASSWCSDELLSTTDSTGNCY